MRFKGIIFDLDGTLADTLEDIADNANRALAAMGYPAHTYAAVRTFIGDGLQKLIASCLPEHARTEAIITQCHERLLLEYHASFIDHTHLYCGIPGVLDILTQKKIKLAVLSNKASALVQKICRILLKNWTFEAVMGAGERFPRKPDPQSSLYIAARMGLPPEDICFVGDSDIDMQTASSAGCYPIGAAWGFRPEDELRKSGARHIIHYPSELLRLLAEK